MAAEPTHEDARLLLELYDLRREKVLRRARDFVGQDLKFKDFKDYEKRYPQGGKQSRYVAMVLGYWDLACALVARGLISEELFNSTNFEHVGVWFKLRPVVEAFRKQYKSDWIMKSLETVATRHPGAATYQQMMEGDGKKGKKTRKKAKAGAAPAAPPIEEGDEE